MRVLGLILVPFLMNPAMAETPRAVVGTFDEVVDGANSVAALPNGLILVVKPTGSLVCALDVAEPYFRLFLEGKEAVTRVPRAVCSSLKNVEFLGDKE